MSRITVLLSLALTLVIASPAFAQWGGYGSGYGQGMARNAARYAQAKVRHHARRMMQKKRAPKQKKVKQDKQQKDDAPNQSGNQLPEKPSTGNMSPSSDYPEWPPPAEQSREVPLPTPSGF